MGLFVLFFALGAGQEALASSPYRVKNGDNVAKISKKFGVSVKALKEANNLQSDALKIRQVLVIPQSTRAKVTKASRTAPAVTATYVVASGDTLYRISRKTGVSVRDLRMMNGIGDNSLRVGQRLALARMEPPEAAADEGSADRIERANASALSEGDELEDDEAGPSGTEEWAKAGQDDQDGADFLGKWESPGERQLMARVAVGFLGAPYRFGGSSVKGLDCSAFVRKIYAFFDINLPRTAREQARIGKRIAREELEVGDLVFFNTRRRAFGHVGIYIGNNEFVHASSGRARAVRVDTLDKPYYSKRFIKAVRLKALGDDA
jgi:cell wall-associated NlpC family hydrolase